MDVLDKAKASAGGSGAGFDVILESTTVLRRNHDSRTLHRMALDRKEGELSNDGALVVDTGHHTGRSPKDKFIVREPATEATIAWESNSAISREAFEGLRSDILDYVRHKEIFVQHLIAGADPRHQIRVKVFTELAWHSLFIRNLLRLPDAPPGDDWKDGLTIIAVPGFKAEPERYGIRTPTVIACDFTGRTVLIAGTSYAGEIKKAVFTFLNYLLPEHGVLPMHCSANVGENGDVAIFFGLSGTGKTTLSATADRTLIGDDEHGWGTSGIFNFEGGCYAKVIGLSATDEPQIYAATNRFGTVLENVVLHPETGHPQFDDISKTENTRAAYPLSHVANAHPMGQAGHPTNIVMLTADAFGVLPPIAWLTARQAVYYFLSGFTARVAGTEKGISEPEPTFSACFGAPFMPRRPIDYGRLLLGLIREHRPNCWLVNTGWTGGPYGVGTRMPIKVTRAVLDAALNGTIPVDDLHKDERFGFRIPTSIEGVPTEILSPKSTWSDPDAYDRAADKLAKMFVENFAKVGTDIDPAVAAAGPRAGG
jgi:phosphoenolpyruvate carboxykinase (ATP)